MVNGNLLGLLRNGAFLSSLSGKADLNFGNSAKTQAERTGAGKKKFNRKHLYTETYEKRAVLRQRKAFAFSALSGYPFTRNRRYDGVAA